MNISQKWMYFSGWIAGPPYLAAYRNCFVSEKDQTLRLTWSADERAVLFCDGKRIADGPHRGSEKTWFTATTEVQLEKGPHVLVFLLMALGKTLTAHAQTSIVPGIYVAPNDVLAPDWEIQLALGCSFAPSKTDWGSFAHFMIDEFFNWDIFSGKGGVWKKAVYSEDNRNLQPSPLPEMSCTEITDYTRIGNYFLFKDYVKVYGEYEFSGTGVVRLRWAEPGTEPEKLDEAFISGVKPGEAWPYLSGTGDQIILTGKKIRFFDCWWHAGRTLQITLLGNAKLESARFFRTDYPWELKRKLEIPGDPRMTQLLRKSWATLKACTGETFMDCPYYEQLQYISDTRFDMLSLYELTDDTRLTEKALRQFAEGCGKKGYLSCRYPTKNFAEYEPKHGELCTLHIPAFTAFYIQMVHDFARRRKNDALIRELLPVLRRAMDFLLSCRMADGVLRVPGWNFIDWRDDWEGGIPPDCEDGTGGTLNLIVLLSLKDLIDIEQCFGSQEYAGKYQQNARDLAAAIRKKYYIPARGIFCENDAGYVCEHTQIFALLALGETAVIPELESGKLPECGIAFGFYYLEACRIFGLKQLFDRRMEKYLQTAELPGYETMPEVFPGSAWFRSECHAWSAHAIYHCFTEGTISDRIPKNI